MARTDKCEDRDNGEHCNNKGIHKQRVVARYVGDTCKACRTTCKIDRKDQHADNLPEAQCDNGQIVSAQAKRRHADDHAENRSH